MRLSAAAGHVGKHDIVGYRGQRVDLIRFRAESSESTPLTNPASPITSPQKAYGCGVVELWASRVEESDSCWEKDQKKKVMDSPADFFFLFFLTAAALCQAITGEGRGKTRGWQDDNHFPCEPHPLIIHLHRPRSASQLPPLAKDNKFLCGS